MKQTILVAAFALCASLAATAATNTIASPDGRLTVTIADEAGRISYSVAYDGKPMIARSALGLKANIGDFSAGLTQLKADTGTIEKTYTMANAKASRIDYRARLVYRIKRDDRVGNIWETQDHVCSLFRSHGTQIFRQNVAMTEELSFGERTPVIGYAFVRIRQMRCIVSKMPIHGFIKILHRATFRVYCRY